MELWQKTEDELGALGLPPPFWAFAWAGGQALARHVLDNPDLVRGKRVLDFACGCGLVGIAAMMSGAESCTGVDVDAFAIEAGKLNAELNGVSLEFIQDDITAGNAPEVDVIFCGDVFYDKSMADNVLAFLDQQELAETSVLIGDPGRSYLPKSRLSLVATYEVPVVGALEDAEIKKSNVFRFIRQC